MRIIAGDLKGRHIKAVPGKETRPTSYKIKEAIFHKMGPYFSNGNCLDVFAGSGSLGIEAISRGMDKVVFIEKAKQAVQTIRHNLQQLSIQEQCEVYHMDAFRALGLLAKKQNQYDLILIDPPYEKVSYEKILQCIQANDLLKQMGKVYIEYGPSKPFMYDSEYFSLSYEKKYSNITAVMILEKNSNGNRGK